MNYRPSFAALVAALDSIFLGAVFYVSFCAMFRSIGWNPTDFTVTWLNIAAAALPVVLLIRTTIQGKADKAGMAKIGEVLMGSGVRGAEDVMSRALTIVGSTKATDRIYVVSPMLASTTGRPASETVRRGGLVTRRDYVNALGDVIGKVRGIDIVVYDFLNVARAGKAENVGFVRALSGEAALITGEISERGRITAELAIGFFEKLQGIVRKAYRERIVADVRIHLSESIPFGVIFSDKPNNEGEVLLFAGSLPDQVVPSKGIGDFHRAVPSVGPMVGFYTHSEYLQDVLRKSFAESAGVASDSNLLSRIEPCELLWCLARVEKRLKRKTVLGDPSEERVWQEIEAGLAPIVSRNYLWAGTRELTESWKTFTYQAASTIRGKKNLLIVPSSAGLYCDYTDVKQSTVNAYRMDCYSELCRSFAAFFNVHLVSLSGQSPEDREIPGARYSCEKSLMDIAHAIADLENKFGDIHCAFGVCTGALEISQSMKIIGNREMPLICWDTPAVVGWDRNYEWFVKKFPGVNVDENKFRNAPEPKDILPEHNGGIWMFHSQDNSQYEQSEFAELYELAKRKNPRTDRDVFGSLGHIPLRRHCEAEYERLLDRVKSVVLSSGLS